MSKTPVLSLSIQARTHTHTLKMSTGRPCCLDYNPVLERQRQYTSPTVLEISGLSPCKGHTCRVRERITSQAKVISNLKVKEVGEKALVILTNKKLSPHYCADSNTVQGLIYIIFNNETMILMIKQ